MTDAASAPRRHTAQVEPQATDLDHLDQGLIDRARPDDLPPSPADERRDLAERAEGQAADAAARGAQAGPDGVDADASDSIQAPDPIQAEVAALVTSGPFRAAGHAEDGPDMAQVSPGEA
ncbi:hypothetical protein [Zavarzinia sp. CC-PAN008]|uniref:hypothetical protein n=1 Tax=Zavarzinia sp. CC-PAN008 TaxID=3243332 RepID=UPI003F742D95